MKPSLPLQPFLVSKHWRHEAGSGLSAAAHQGLGASHCGLVVSVSPEPVMLPHSQIPSLLPSPCHGFHPLMSLLGTQPGLMMALLGGPIIEWGPLDLG